VCRPILISLLAMGLCAPPAQALHLSWSSGATTLFSSDSTVASLVLKADSSETSLPSEWRLIWVADSSGLIVRQVANACEADTANVDSLMEPASLTEVAANQRTANFCSAAADLPALAVFSVAIPRGGRGKLKVAALTDGGAVTSSNQVTYNGGALGAYPPAILSATSFHPTTELHVNLIGLGLSDIRTVGLGSPDSLWSVSLTIVSQTDQEILADAAVLSELPAATVTAISAYGATSIASVAAEDLLSLSSSPSAVDTTYYVDPDPNIYPKDFAFYFNTVPSSNPLHPWRGLFHLIYIRHNIATGAELSIGHAWSDSLAHFHTDSTSMRFFVPSGGANWDAKNVWAPSILPVGNLTYMFYTGVDNSSNQRIGYVTTASLDTTDTVWSSTRKMVFDADSTLWVDRQGAVFSNAQQFRDPFVMPDPHPDSTGRYIMYYVGQDKRYVASAGSATTSVGVAKNTSVSSFDRWSDYGQFRATDSTHVGVPLAPVAPNCTTHIPPVVESPMAMKDSLTGAWRVFFSNANYNCAGTNSSWFISSTGVTSPEDTTLSKWGGLTNMYTYVGDNNELIGWEAAEHLQVGDKWHFFAAYNGQGIGITQAHWDIPNQRFVIGRPDLAGVDRSEPTLARFFLAELRPGSGQVRFGLDSPRQVIPRLVVYDIMGRKVRLLAERVAVTGRREYVWDCRDQQGASVSSGVYFARMTGIGRAKVLRVPILR